MKKINSDSIKIYPISDRGTNTTACWSKLYTEHNISTISNRIVPIYNNSFIITSSLPSKVNNVWQSSDIFEFIIKGYYVNVQLKAIEEAINEEDVEYDYMEDFVWFTTEEKDGENIVYANVKQNEYDGKDIFYNCIDGEDTADKTLSEDWMATFSFPILNYIISTDTAYLIDSIYEDSRLNLVELDNVVINNKGEDLTITDNEFITSQEADDSEAKGNINIEEDLSVSQTLQLSENLIINNPLSFKNDVTSCGSDTNFIYLQDGIITASDNIVGSVSTPIYLNNGEINSSNKICTNLTENSVALGLINIENSNINMGDLVSINKNDVSIGNSFYAKKDTSIGCGSTLIEVEENRVINIGVGVKSNTRGQITFVNSYTAGDKNTPIYLNNGEFKSATIPLVTMSSSGYLSSEDYKNLNTLYNWYVSTSLLESVNWKIISNITKTGLANSFWAVGDTKSITIQGTIGTLSIDTTLYCYILGFNHNSSIEGNNTIHFGTFKDSSGTDICLVRNYGILNTSGSLAYFNINHWEASSYWGGYNYGGWAACDLRYDILGSTDVPPYRSGTSSNSDYIGYNATDKCATEPVQNTLMECLPEELRDVMKGVTKWSDNTGGGYDTSDNVTPIIDYLPLLSEYEVTGSRRNANSEEQNHQQQYDYYANGEKSKIKYRHSATTTAAAWWLRSSTCSENLPYAFCYVTTSGSSSHVDVAYSYGISPVFVV